MSRRPWYQWFPGDYLNDTSHLTPQADLLYRRLLDIHWRDGFIPAELEEISELSRLPVDWVEGAWPSLKRYFINPGGRRKRLVNKRMRGMLDAYCRIAQARTDAGKASANKRLRTGVLDPDPDPDPDPDLKSSVLLSSESTPIAEREQRGSVRGSGRTPAAPSTVVVSILPGLNMKAWGDYQQHRTDIRVRKLKPKSVERLQRWLVAQGDEAHQALIVDQTIRNGWTGLFELKASHKPRGANKSTVSDEEFNNWLNEGNTYEGEYEKQ